MIRINTIVVRFVLRISAIVLSAMMRAAIRQG